MNIEFIGLPGSGKTTLRNRLAASFEEAGKARYLTSERAYLEVARHKIDPIFRRVLTLLPQTLAMSLCDRLSYRSVVQADAKVEFLARYGRALSVFLESQTFMNMALADRQRVIDSFLGAGGYWQFLQDAWTRDRFVMFEEGLVQKSFMFVDHADNVSSDEGGVLTYLQNIPAPKCVVYVKASIDEAKQRMIARPDGLTQRLKTADESTIHRFLCTAQAHLDIVARWLAEQESITLVTVSNHDNTPESYEKLHHAIASL